MKDAGLTIREDPMGNIYGRLHGSSDTAGTDHRVMQCLACPRSVTGVVCSSPKLCALLPRSLDILTSNAPEKQASPS